MHASTTRLVVGVLGLLALAVVIGGIVLALNDKALPGELIAIGSAAAGAIGGILTKSDAAEVRVVNPPEDPVPVEADQHPTPTYRTGDRGHIGPTETILVLLLIAVVVVIVL